MIVRTLLAVAALVGEDPVVAAPVDFVRDVRPILSRYCLACHGGDEGAREADLRLDRRDSVLAPRAGYQVIVPGDPEASELLYRVTATEEAERMPPAHTGRTVSAAEVDLLRRWIQEGAPYQEHWAFVPPRRPALPAVAAEGWCRDPLDRFVLAHLERLGRAPAPPADPASLLRRVSLDLTGLPPTPEEVQAFLADPSDAAYRDAVERLLAGPAYAERQASLWLDLARYADSSGYGSDPLRTIWRYRDWVIQAFDRNLPFDQFTREQLAGDLLPDATTEQRLATAFHRNTMTNTEGGTDDEEFRVAAVKDRLHTTLQGWMGLTVGCAQCHSHKFDPISHREYYQLFDFLNQTADADRNDDAPRLATPSAEERAARRALEEREEELERAIAEAVPDVRARVRTWEQEEEARLSSWQPVAGGSLRSDAGLAATVLDDGSFLVQGPGGERDTQEVTLPLRDGVVRALRLEALTHESLPRGGPGRSPGNGNFVLREVEVTVPADGRPVRARGLRVRIPGRDRILSLAEVEVFEADRNVAGEGTARQSSTGWGGEPGLAIDGNTSGEFDQDRSVTHTEVQDDPWWELHFDRDVAVSRLVLWNRTDHGHGARLKDFRVELLDGEGRTVWRTALREPPQPSLTLAPGIDPQRLALGAASADFEQEDYEVRGAADGDPQSGWAIAPRQGTAHQAVFELESPWVSREGQRLVLRLLQDYGSGHVLGRLRWSLSGREGDLAEPPAAVQAARARPAAQRSEEEWRVLEDHVRARAPEVLALVQERSLVRRQQETLPITTTPVLEELPADRRRRTHVLVLGNFLQPTEEVQAGVPAFLHPFREEWPRNRLGLAEWLVAPDNPLTARVLVNRLWAELFGRGIVATLEDFGTQGDLPSHPELLDWLAVEMMESGWDWKGFLRKVVLSATYRQSSERSGDEAGAGPDHQHLGRGPRRRLTAEMVRDQALAISGLLSTRRFGPSVYPPQPDGLWQAAFNNQRNWPTSQGEDRHRRALYTFLRRTVPYPSMATFDAPSRELCTLRRMPTNTPLQALVTWNDPAFVEMAQGLARRLIQEVPEGDADRARRGLWLALQRPPTAAEVAPLVSLAASELAHYAAHPEDAQRLATDPLGPLPEGWSPVEAAAWTVVANVLLNLDACLVNR